MNPRIRKEFRSLLLMVCVTPVAAVAPSLIWPQDTDGLWVGTLLFAVCCAAMGASSFGNEFHWRTMPQLLAQPISRKRLWYEKLLALGIALFVTITLSLTVLVPTSMVLGPHVRGWPVLWALPLSSLFQLLRMILFTAATISLGAVCMSPFLALLARNTVGGLVFSLALPPFILAPISIAQRYVSISTTCSYVVYTGFAALFYLLGYRKFLKLQVVDGFDQSIRLPQSVENAFAAPFRIVFGSHSSPIASLIKKEFRIQQVSVTIAALVCLLGLAVCWVWRFNHDTAILLTVLGIFVLGFILPLLIAALAVVEEKAWGLAEWHATLPVSALKQWLAKMVITFTTSLALGVVLPVLLFFLFRALTGSWQFGLPSILIALSFNLLLTCIAVYAASLSTNTIRAMFLTFGMSAAIVGVVGIGETFLGGWDVPSSASEIPEIWTAYFLTFFGLFFLFQRFAFLNFKRHELSVKRALLQVLSILFLIFLFASYYPIPN